MRLVDLRDEIPVTELTEEAIERRKAACEIPLSPKLANKVRAINTYLEKLSDRNGDLDIESFMRRVYKLVDEICAPIAKQSVCKKGCAHCCQVPVGVTNIEMAYIHMNTGVKVEDVKQVSTVKPSPDLSYCPLLDQEKGMCSAYEYRPIHCRSFYTIDDPKYCVGGDQGHYIFAVEASDALKYLRTLLENVSQCNPRYAEWSDIRYWVKHD